MFNKLVKAKNSKKGFTLIEVMVVVAIIAILAAVAIPAYLSYKEETKAGVARASFVTIMESYNGYLTINGAPETSKLDIANASAGDVATFLKNNGATVMFDRFDSKLVSFATVCAADPATGYYTMKSDADLLAAVKTLTNPATGETYESIVEFWASVYTDDPAEAAKWA